MNPLKSEPNPTNEMASPKIKSIAKWVGIVMTIVILGVTGSWWITSRNVNINRNQMNANTEQIQKNTAIIERHEGKIEESEKGPDTTTFYGLQATPAPKSTQRTQHRKSPPKRRSLWDRILNR